MVVVESFVVAAVAAVSYVAVGDDDGDDVGVAAVVVLWQIVAADLLPRLDFVADLNVGVSIDVYDVLLNSLKRNVADDTKMRTRKRMRRMMMMMTTTKMLLLLCGNSSSW